MKLPDHAFTDFAGIKRNFDALIKNSIFRDTTIGGDLTGTLPNPTLDLPQCRASSNANQSIPHNTLTAITLNTELFDQGAASQHHDTVTNNSRLTAVEPGLYLIVAAMFLDTTGGGNRFGHIALNGVSLISSFGLGGFTYAVALSQPIFGSTLYRLSAGHYVELAALQDSGVARDSVASSGMPYLSFVKLSA